MSLSFIFPLSFIVHFKSDISESLVDPLLKLQLLESFIDSRKLRGSLGTAKTWGAKHRSLTPKCCWT